MPTEPNPPKVFISYSHDSQEHSSRVLRLSDTLREWGINCHIDQYEIAPSNWLKWMESQFQQADFVIVVCTETYCHRFESSESLGLGLGVRWESAIITAELYGRQNETYKFIPVVFSAADTAFIPTPLQASTRHVLNIEQLEEDRGFEYLYRHLTKQPRVIKPPVSKIEILPSLSSNESHPIISPVEVDQAQPIEIFYSYSHCDELLRDELVKHLSLLKRKGLIKNWHDREITPAAEWRGQIDRHLESSQIILLLISADFLASDYCWNIEMKRALERHDAGEAYVAPIILRDVDWSDAPFAKLAVLPTDGKAVTNSCWNNTDEAFVNIASGIRKLVIDLLDSQAKTRITPAVY